MGGRGFKPRTSQQSFETKRVHLAYVIPGPRGALWACHVADFDWPLKREYSLEYSKEYSSEYSFFNFFLKKITFSNVLDKIFF